MIMDAFIKNNHVRAMALMGNLLVALCLGLSLTGCDPSAADRSADIDGHHFVDLQLPSGLLWAATNLGATDTTGCGQQYAWGETAVKADYSQATYRYGTDFEKMTKYNATDHLDSLSSSDDVATTLWGKDCRTPTFSELEELGDTTNCTWTWVTKTTDKGKTVKGYEVKSVRNGNSIFLPATGAHNGKNYFCEDDGLYWTSTRAERSPGEAWCLYFNLGHYSYYMNARYIGASIRPVAMPR